MRDVAVVPASDLSSTLQLLRDGRPRTRSELAKMTGRTRAIISARVDELFAAKLLTSVGEGTSTGGRPPAVFAFNPGARIIVAIDLGATHLRVAATDLSSVIAAEMTETIAIDDGPEVVLQRAAVLAGTVVESCGRSLADVAGVGIGLPGPVEPNSGRSMNLPMMPGWEGADVAGMLSVYFGAAPVLVENDVHLMALGEQRLAYPTVDDLIFVKIGTGVGAGIISGGRISRGVQGASGSLGHVAVPGGRDASCPCGNTGCLEVLASIPAIVAECRRVGVEARSIADVIALSQSGNEQVLRVLQQAGRDIGKVLATCVSVLNPAVVAIGSELGSGQQLLAGIREVVYVRPLPIATHNLTIVSSRVGSTVGVLGASIMVADHVLSNEGLPALQTIG